MKILYILEHYYPYIGGAEKLFCNVAEAMAKQGNQVTVVTTLYDKSLPKREIMNDVRIIRLNCYNRYLFTFFATWNLLISKKDYDVVHATTYNAALPAWIYSKISGTTSVLTFHEVWGKLWFELPFLSTLERFIFYVYEQTILLLKFDHYVAVSESTRKALISNGIPPDRTKLVYNGIDYSEVEPRQHRAKGKVFTFLYFGRLGVSKGLDLLIPAFLNLGESHDKLELKLVVPRKPTRMLKKVTNLIRSFPSRHSIRMMHELKWEDLKNEISSAHAVVIPSYSEGFCYVAVETCSLGTPVIHSNRTALKEVISGRHIAYEEQSVNSLKRALEMALSGNWHLIKTKRFHLHESVLKYTDLYNEITR